MSASNVRAFHAAAGQPVDMPLQAGNGSIKLMNTRALMIVEEFREVVSAISSLQAALVQKRGPEYIAERIAHLRKELADLKYVTNGFGVTFGFPVEADDQLVHESNLTKANPDGTFTKDDNGKVVKSALYREPVFPALTVAA